MENNTTLAMLGLAGIEQAIGANAAKQYNKQASIALKKDASTRNQKLFIAKSGELSLESQARLKSGDYRLVEKEFYVTRYMNLTGATVASSNVKLLQESSDSIDGVCNFSKDMLPSGMNALVVGYVSILVR